MTTKIQEKSETFPDLVTIKLDDQNLVDAGSIDELAWGLAFLLCRQCWQPWWKHGHGPFASLIDEHANHLFDAL